MPGHDIIVIGGSAGGLEAMNAIVSGLPADLPAAVFFVLHTSPHSPGLLPQIFNHRGPLPAAVSPVWTAPSSAAGPPVEGLTAVVTGGDRVAGLDPATGRERWSYRRGRCSHGTRPSLLQSRRAEVLTRR